MLPNTIWEPEKNNNRYYLHYDQVGSLRVVTDTNGNIVKEITYDSYGNIISDTNPSFKVPFGFAGGLYDADTKLVHFGYREYDPEIGRWLGKDPLLFGGGDTNLYGYVLQDPVNLVDPWGLAWIDIFLPTDTLNGGEEETIAKRVRDLNKWQRFRLEKKIRGLVITITSPSLKLQK